MLLQDLVEPMLAEFAADVLEAADRMVCVAVLDWLVLGREADLRRTRC